MKTILTTCTAVCFIALSACQEPVRVYEAPKKKFEVIIQNGTGFSMGYSIISCDSFKFKSSKNVIIYVDGTELEVFADNKIYARDSK